MCTLFATTRHRDHTASQKWSRRFFSLTTLFHQAHGPPIRRNPLNGTPAARPTDRPWSTHPCGDHRVGCEEATHRIETANTGPPHVLPVYRPSPTPHPSGTRTGSPLAQYTHHSLMCTRSHMSRHSHMCSCRQCSRFTGIRPVWDLFLILLEWYGMVVWKVVCETLIV